MTATPFLARWFALMVSDAPGRVLDRISDDFTTSVQFSKGADVAAEFTGDHAFNASALLDADTDRCRCLLNCRTP